MDHKQVRFEHEEMVNDPPIFAEPHLDYDNVAINPRDNPINIQHALLNKGMYPASFQQELDRFLTD